MADIASLLANAAQTNADFDFGKLNKSYWEGLEQAYKQRARDAFQDPSLYGPGGQIDPSKIAGQALRAGGLPAAKSAAELFDVGIQQRLWGNVDNRAQPERPIPPSLNQNNFKADQPDLTQSRRTPQTPQAIGGDQKGSLVGFLSANGVPDETAGNEINILGGKLSSVTGRRIDPNSPLDMNNPQVRNILTEYIRGRKPLQPPTAQAAGQPQVAQGERVRIFTPNSEPPGAVPQQQAAPQQPVRPQPPMQLEPGQVTDPTLGGRITYEELREHKTPQAVVNHLYRQLARGVPKELEPSYRMRAKDAADELSKQLTPTTEAKTAAAVQMTPREKLEYEARTPEEKLSKATGRPVTEIVDAKEEAQKKLAQINEIRPIITKSYEGASAAKTAITGIHTAREALDAPGGVITGKWAEDQLQLKKIVRYFGIDSQKIKNTEMFNAAIAERTKSMVSSLPGALSEKELDFLGKISGSKELDEQSLRELLNIAEKASREKIKSHRELLERGGKVDESLSGSNEFFGVVEPGAYQRKLHENQIISNGKIRMQVKNGKLVRIP